MKIFLLIRSLIDGDFLIISCIPRFFEFGVIYHVMYRTASFGVFLSFSLFFFLPMGEGGGVGGLCVIKRS